MSKNIVMVGSKEKGKKRVKKMFVYGLRYFVNKFDGHILFDDLKNIGRWEAVKYCSLSYKKKSNKN
jgi:hypothetical protein